MLHDGNFLIDGLSRLARKRGSVIKRVMQEAKVDAVNINKPTPRAAFLTVVEAGAMIGVGRTMIYTLMGEGRLKSVRIGSKRLIAREEVEAFIAKLNAEAV